MKIIQLLILLFCFNSAFAFLPNNNLANTPTDQNNDQDNSPYNRRQYMPQSNSANVVLVPNQQENKLLQKMFDKANYHSLHREKGKIPLDSTSNDEDN